MNTDIEIKVPKEWSAVSLKDYLALRKDMEAYKDEPDEVADSEGKALYSAA
jgi:hypothetical protein